MSLFTGSRRGVCNNLKSRSMVQLQHVQTLCYIIIIKIHSATSVERIAAIESSAYNKLEDKGSNW